MKTALLTAWLWPLLLASRLAGPVLQQDLARRRSVTRAPTAAELLAELATDEFRAVLYLRLRSSGIAGQVLQRVLRVAYKPPAACFLPCEDVGPGFDVMHGFATIVNAERMGRDCTVSQQVTIGQTADGRPSFGDRVSVLPGAIIVGPVQVGSGVVIGAGAVVVRDVPDGATVAGVPARVLGPSDRATEAERERLLSSLEP